MHGVSSQGVVATLSAHINIGENANKLKYLNHIIPNCTHRARWVRRYGGYTACRVRMLWSEGVTPYPERRNGHAAAVMARSTGTSTGIAIVRPHCIGGKPATTGWRSGSMSGSQSGWHTKMSAGHSTSTAMSWQERWIPSRPSKANGSFEGSEMTN